MVFVICSKVFNFSTINQDQKQWIWIGSNILSLMDNMHMLKFSFLKYLVKYCMSKRFPNMMSIAKIWYFANVHIHVNLLLSSHEHDQHWKCLVKGILNLYWLFSVLTSVILARSQIIVRILPQVMFLHHILPCVIFQGYINILNLKKYLSELEKYLCIMF